MTESILAVDKAFNRFEIADAMQGLQAGDRVIYDIQITNSGDAPAFDIVLDDLAAEQLINPVVTAAPDSPGAPTVVGTTAGVTTYRWNIAGPIAASGGTYAFELSLELDVTVQPMEMLTNGAAITWTSLAGTSAFERSGDDGEGAGLNNYAASENAPVTITTGTVLFTKVEDSAGDGTYAPGEVIEYDLSFTAGQGTIQDVRLRDDLPAGLVVVSSNLVANGYQRPGGGAVTLLSGPAAGATGTLNYDIGDIESTMASPTIELTLRAYVDDVPGNTAATDLTNSADLLYDDPGNPGSDISVNAQTAPVVGVVEPSFGLTLDAPATGGLGVTQDFELRVENQGDGAAWQPTLQLQLPLGMRDYDPLGDTFTVSVEGGRDVALTLGVDYTVTYNPLTGDLVLMLTGTGGFIGDDEELVIDWRGQVDENAVDGASLQPVATLTEAFSADTSSGNPDGLRTYTNAFGSGTQGTGNGVPGDDATDNAAMSAGVPVLAVTKSVDNAVAEAGTFLHYQITITNTGSVDSGASTLIDDLDPNIASGTTQNELLVPAAGTVAVNQNGGVNGTGQVRVDGLVVAAGTSVTLDFDTGIRRPLPNGVVVENQASLTVPFFGNPFLSDSTNPADDDAVEAGNDSAILSDDDPTRTVIGARPEITIAKVDSDPSGAPLESGDEILYTLTFDNEGNETGVNAVLTDSIPGNTTYVPGSTTLNNVPVADVGGTSPLVSGLVIQSPGAAAGTLDVDAPGTVTFRVTLDAGLQPGTIITNQASVVVDGLASGTQPPFSSDDPATGADGDATRSIVGDVASVDATKTVVDVNGGTADPGDVLVYRIEVLNSGGGDATGVVLTDSIPVGTTLVASSMSYDADGGGPGGATALTDAVDGDLADAGGTQPGAITLLRGDLAGGESFALEFQVTIDAGATGAVVNQGVISRDGAPDESTDADGNDGDGDQPTTLGIGSTPILRLAKDVMDLDGGVLEPGDRLRYVLVIENIGSGDADGVSVLDPIAPAGTTYVAGSTVLDGVPLADGGGGDSALVAGVLIGTIEPGRQATITVDVDVAPIATAGTVITNQATYVSSNAGTGTSDSNFDDGMDTGNDPGDGNDDDRRSSHSGAVDPSLR